MENNRDNLEVTDNKNGRSSMGESEPVHEIKTDDLGAHSVGEKENLGALLN